MLNEPLEAVPRTGRRLADCVAGEVEETVARVGGGALPLAELPSFACAVEEELAEPLRAGEPPVVGVVRDGRLLLDCRTLTDAEAEEVATAVAAARDERAAAGGRLEPAARRRSHARALGRRASSASPRRSREARGPSRRSRGSGADARRSTASCARSRATASSPRTEPGVFGTRLRRSG
jgi:hypothetical protein